MEKIFIITAGAVKKGLSFGHFFRSIELNNYLKKKFQIFFLITHPNKKVANYLRDKKINFKFINKNSINKFLRNKNFKYLVVDLPNPNLKINHNKSKLIIFDEFLRFKGNCNYYLTTNIFKKLKKKYLNYHQNISFRFFKFLNKKIKKRAKIKKIKNILILTGGSDLMNINKTVTKKILKEKLLKYDFYFVVPFSKNNNNFSPQKNIKYINYNSAFNRINMFDLAITNGGNSMFEMIFLKIPCLCFSTNILERLNIDYFQKTKMVLKFKKNQSLESQINFFSSLKNFNSKFKTIFKKNENLKKILGNIFI